MSTHLDDLLAAISNGLDAEVWPDVHRRARAVRADPSDENVWGLLTRIEERVNPETHPRIRRLAAELAAAR